MNLSMKNGKACVDSLMNGHWEELFGKLEELLHATDHPDNNYRMLIQPIIQYTSDGQQRLKSFLRLHVIKHVRGVIEAIECEWLCIDPCRPPRVDMSIQVDQSSFNC